MLHIFKPRTPHARHRRQGPQAPNFPDSPFAVSVFSAMSNVDASSTTSSDNLATSTSSLPPSPAQSSTTSSSSTFSSTSSSSSSSSTPSSTSTTSTTLTTSSIISTTSTTTTPPPTSSSISTFTLFQTQPEVTSPSHPSPTSTGSPAGGVSAGIIAGGIFAALLGTAGVFFAVIYFLRRFHRNRDDALAEEIWNRPDVIRQSVILPDEPGPVRPYNPTGYGSPRPPAMIERHLNSSPSMSSRHPSLPRMYPNNMYGNTYANGYGTTAYAQPSFAPGEVMSPTSANPFISPYARDVMASPVSSNVPDYHQQSPVEPTVPAPALTRLPSNVMKELPVVYQPPVDPTAPPPGLTRQLSNGTREVPVAYQNTSPAGPHSPVISSPDATDPNYVDLSRSSVTPFQAAQYAEITERLRTPMPSVLEVVPVASSAGQSNQRRLTPPTGLPPPNETASSESPFINPGTEQPAVDASQELEMDVPLPTPILYQHSRISSTPPMLPEIRVPDRSFSPVASLEFPVPLSARDSPSPFTAEFSDLRTPPPEGLKYKSSPLSASSPTQDQPSASTIPREIKTEGEPAKRPDTVYTMYDEDDAYGGI